MRATREVRIMCMECERQMEKAGLHRGFDQRRWNSRRDVGVPALRPPISVLEK